MKKVFIALCCVVLLLSSVSAGYCEDDGITDGQQNGRWIIRLTQAKENFKGRDIAMLYCIGLIDAIKIMRGREMLSELYGPSTTTGEMFEAICLYYQNNPTQRSRSVIDVLLSGAK
jgi:hypothetical protein